MNSDKTDSIVVPSQRDMVLVPIADIIYLMADKKYVSVITRTQTYRIEDSLDRLGGQLGEQFIRTHRKYLVRVSAIRTIVAVDVTKYLDVVDVPDPIPVSRRESVEVRQRLKLRVL